MLPILSKRKMVLRICEITVTLDFIFRLVHCSCEDVSFNSTCLNVLEGIKQFYLLMRFKKTRLETPFKGDNVNVKLWKLGPLLLWESSENCSICFAFLVFSDQTFVWKKNGSAYPNDQKYARYPLVFKLNVTLARPLRLVILYFLYGKSCQMIGACIFMTANETQDLMWMSSSIQNNC